MRSMSVSILEARVHFALRPFRTPLLLSSGPITEITAAYVEVRVRVEGREAVGSGSIYLSDVWAWPDPSLSHGLRDAAMSEPVLRPLDNIERYIACVRYTVPRTGQVSEHMVYFLGGQINQFVKATPEQCKWAAYKPFPELEKIWATMPQT